MPSIYYAHERLVVERRGLLAPITAITPPRAGEIPVKRTVRFRTVGDITCTCPVLSDAATVEAILLETTLTRITERGATRMDDQTSDASMELRKKEGYFYRPNHQANPERPLPASLPPRKRGATLSRKRARERHRRVAPLLFTGDGN